MGKLSGMFGDLTNTQLATPGGPTVSNPDPGQVAHAMSQSAQPSMQDPTSGGFTAPPQGPQASVSKPSFLSAMSTGPGGTPNALSPGLTKGGKLLTILAAAAKGGLAGQAAGMQGNPRTGYGGFGAGAEAGMNLPFMQAQQKQALQEGQIQQQLQQAQIQNLPFARQAQQAGLAKTQAETKKAQAETELLPSKEGLNAARTASLQEKAPDLQHLYAQAVQSGDTAAAQKYGDAIQAVQKEAAPKTPNRDDRAIAIMQKPAGQRTPEETSYLTAYRAFVKENKIDPSVMRAEIFTGNRAVPVADDSGRVTYQKASTAIAQGAQAPASAQPAAAKALQKEFTSGSAAKSLNAFNTASAHLALLKELGGALGNGDITMLNRLGQAYKTQTGNAAPTNFNMAKNAVAGEIAKTFKGSATQGEIDAINSTINNAMSPMALNGAIQTAIELMASKKQALKQQYEQGLQGQPAFNGGASASPAQSAPGDPLGIR